MFASNGIFLHSNMDTFNSKNDFIVLLFIYLRYCFRNKNTLYTLRFLAKNEYEKWFKNIYSWSLKTTKIAKVFFNKV